MNYPILEYTSYDQALEVAMEISKQELRGLQIVTRCDDTKFIIVTNIDRDRKSHDYMIMWVQNFESPYEIHSISPKSGEHIEGFPTTELADARYKELTECGYRKNIYKKYPKIN